MIYNRTPLPTHLKTKVFLSFWIHMVSIDHGEWNVAATTTPLPPTPPSLPSSLIAPNFYNPLPLTQIVVFRICRLTHTQTNINNLLPHHLSFCWTLSFIGNFSPTFFSSPPLLFSPQAECTPIQCMVQPHMILIGRENNDDEVKREQGTTHDFLEIVLFCLASPSSYNLVHFFILLRAQPTPINPYVHVSYVGIHTSCLGKEKREQKKGWKMKMLCNKKN